MEELLKAYLQGKGHPWSEQKTLARALIHAMEFENNGRKASLIEKCNELSLEVLSLAEVTVPHERRYSAVEPREPSSPGSAPSIFGVVYKNEGHYHLVDGYHRIKWAREQGVVEGFYWVLSVKGHQ